MEVGIRADGGVDRGYGHVVRTATLARELRARGHRIVYLTATPDAVRRAGPTDCRIRELGDDAPETLVGVVREEGIDALVVDRPDPSLDYQRAVRDGSAPLVLVLDDVGRTVDADVVVNGHVYADPDRYEALGAEPIWCVGGDYAVFGEGFRRLANEPAPWRDPPERALVLMGGSDVTKATPGAIRAFDGTGLAVEAVVGPGVEHVAEIEAAAAAADCDASLVHDPSDLAERMLRADLAVTALGLTSYELLAMGTPFVGVVAAADQEPKAAAYRELDAAIVLDADEVDERLDDAVGTLVADTALRRRLYEGARSVVGTDGTARICDGIESVAGA